MYNRGSSGYSVGSDGGNDSLYMINHQGVMNVLKLMSPLSAAFTYIYRDSDNQVYGFYVDKFSWSWEHQP